MAGNFWAQDIPPGTTAVYETLRVVNLCIYRLPKVSISDHEIEAIAREAAKIWCQTC